MRPGWADFGRRARGRAAQKLWRSSASKIQRSSEVPTSLAGGRGNTEAVGQVGLRPSITSIAMLNFVRVFGIFWIVFGISRCDFGN